MDIYARFNRFSDKTLADAAQQYLDDFTGKCKGRQEYALRPIVKKIGHLSLFEVDDPALREYKAERRQQVMAGTVNKEISTLTAVMNKAARVWRWIPAAPKFEKVDGPTRKPYPLTWPEQSALFGFMGEHLRRLSIFAVNTGVRREELFQLKWSEERDINGVKLFILRETKNGEDRPVILNSIARRIIEAVRGENEQQVFRSLSISKPFNKAWVKSGLPDHPLIRKGIHNLRHTFGHRLRAEGIGPEDRDALLGHNKHSLTQHYALPHIERLGELIELITKPRDVAILR